MGEYQSETTCQSKELMNCAVLAQILVLSNVTHNLSFYQKAFQSETLKNPSGLLSKKCTPWIKLYLYKAKGTIRICTGGHSSPMHNRHFWTKRLCRLFDGYKSWTLTYAWTFNNNNRRHVWRWVGPCFSNLQKKDLKELETHTTDQSTLSCTLLKCMSCWTTGTNNLLLF